MPVLKPLSLPDGELFRDILGRVLRLPSVASKRYLTNKVVMACFCSSFFAFSRMCLCVCVHVVIYSGQGLILPDVCSLLQLHPLECVACFVMIARVHSHC